MRVRSDLPRKIKSVFSVCISLTEQNWKDLLNDINDQSIYKYLLKTELDKVLGLSNSQKKKVDLLVSKTPLERIASRYRKRLMSRPTKSEEVFREMLKKYKVVYEYQKVIFSENSFYIVDFYLPEYNAVVEIDGSQHYTSEGLKKDEIRSNHLLSLGIEQIYRLKNRACKEPFLKTWIENLIKAYDENTTNVGGSLN